MDDEGFLHCLETIARPSEDFEAGEVGLAQDD